MLHIDQVSLKYGDKLILDDLSCSILPGEIVGVIGRSGMGKTSFLKVSSAHLDVSAGAVFFEGKKLVGPSVKLIPGYEDLQLVNQDFALDPYHSVEENVREKVLHLPKDQQLFLIDEVLDLVELSDLKSQKSHLLSGGEQQRLALARALACEPAMLFLDEPFVHLDQALRYRIMHYLMRLNELRKTTIVIVSHDGAELMGLVNRMLHLENGKIVRDTTPKEMFYSPESIAQAELLGTINAIVENGVDHFFRPNEYSLSNGTIKVGVTFERSLNTGLIVLNSFTTDTGSNIVLSSDVELRDINHFFIKKRYEDES